MIFLHYKSRKCKHMQFQKIESSCLQGNLVSMVSCDWHDIEVTCT